MWKRSENADSVRPPEIEKSGNFVIVRRHFTLVAATQGDDGKPEHWEYDEWQMTFDEYEMYELEQQRADVDYILMITEGI